MTGHDDDKELRRTNADKELSMMNAVATTGDKTGRILQSISKQLNQFAVFVMDKLENIDKICNFCIERELGLG